MAKFINYKRIVVYQPRSAWVVDLGAGRCKAPLYTNGESYFNSGAGTRKAISRTREMIIEVFDETSIDILRIMHKEGCEMRAIAIGDASIIVWEINSEINFIETNGGIGGFAGGNLVFNTDVYYGSIYQSSNLLGGIPWECETATLGSDGVTYYLPGPDGYTGNLYTGSSGDSVDEDGAATISSLLTLDMYCPIEGATVNLTGSWTGNIKLLDVSGSTLRTHLKSVSGTDSSTTIDAGTWQIQVNVETAASKPIINITDPGSLSDPRRGGCIDCSNLTAVVSTAPDWSS